jgi:hypothetical protein
MLESPSTEAGRRVDSLPGGLTLGNNGSSTSSGSFGLGGLGFLNNYIEQMI